MYICPVCSSGFISEEQVVKHYLACWKEKNPNHKPKPAPHSEDIVNRKVNNEALEFFSSFERKVKQ